MTAEPENPVAQLIATLASGHGTQADHDRLVLELIRKAQERGATWEQIGRLLGYPSGRACKKAAHKLADGVRASGLAADPEGN